MPGNSQRRGALRKTTKGNPTAGSGGRRRRGLEGKGPTPKAKDRVGHVAYQRAKSGTKTGSVQQTVAGSPPSAGRKKEKGEWVAGRNAVVEALRGAVPVAAVYVAESIDRDDRVREAFRLAAERRISTLEVTRQKLDRLTAGATHQGLALQIPPYDYAHPDDLLEAAHDAGEQPLIVALDGITDPRNLGAVVRSAAAFGAHGVVVPERRAAGMTAGAWKASAGAAARVPVARVVNLSRQLRSYQGAGLFVVGLAADGSDSIGDVETTTEPLVLVVGAEDAGLSRLARESCDLVASIPMTRDTESLNAGVAAGIALHEIAVRRRPS